MPRLQEGRKGKALTVRELQVPYSLWPAIKAKRWKLQRRLYVRDPWAVLNEAVYRAKGPAPKDKDEALSYIDQAEEYFNAGMEAGVSVKPVLLYYSMLNLSKCIIKTRNPQIVMSDARHGLSVSHQGNWAVLGDKIIAKTSPRFVNIFSELMQVLENRGPTFDSVTVRELLPQILPGHRLWTYATQKKEKFLAVDVKSIFNSEKKRAWLQLEFDRGELHYIVHTVGQLIKDTNLPGKWRQIKVSKEKDEDIVRLEQRKTIVYQQGPMDCIQGLFQQLRSSLWYVVTAAKPHRKYYVYVDPHQGAKRLPQWAAMYTLFYYLSDLTRYRPHLFDRMLKIKYGPLIENALDECPRQFLYFMASELLRRDVAPAAIVV